VADLLLRVHRLNHLKRSAFRRLLPVAPRLSDRWRLAIIESPILRLGNLAPQDARERKKTNNGSYPRTRSTHCKHPHPPGTHGMLCLSQR
jgi:hypothetical protein